MKQKIIINNTPFMLELDYMHIENLMVDVTCIADPCRNYAASGIRYIEIEGTTKDNIKIAGRFQIINEIDGAFVIKSISD